MAPRPHRSIPALSIRLEMRTGDVHPPLRRFLERELRRLARLAGVRKGSLGIAIIDAREMALLHQRFLGRRSPTDVLSFDLRDRTTDPLEGDLVICLPVAVRQAAARGHAARLEALLYALHGLLHLLGYDDHRPSDAATMHAREDQLLRQAGHGAIFNPSPHGRGQREGPLAPSPCGRG